MSQFLLENVFERTHFHFSFTETGNVHSSAVFKVPNLPCLYINSKKKRKTTEFCTVFLRNNEIMQGHFFNPIFTDQRDQRDE